MSDNNAIQINKQRLFTKNNNGHYVFTITGLNFIGEQEISRLKNSKISISDSAKQLLTMTGADSYDDNHRLENNKQYRVVLIFGRDIKKPRITEYPQKYARRFDYKMPLEDMEHRTTESIQEYARRFGYRMPLAGVMLRIREVISDGDMEQMNIRYVAGLHMPIVDYTDNPSVLEINCGNNYHQFNIAWNNHPWDDEGVFPFFC